MHKEQLQKVVQQVGLSKSEASVYVASLSLGPTSIARIARFSGVERTNVYRVVELLRKKGLMSIQLVGLKKRYVGEDPSHLEHVFAQQQQEFFSALPALKSFYQRKAVSSEVKIYENLTSLKTVYDQLLDEVRHGDFYYVISNIDQWYDTDTTYFTAFAEKRIKRNIFVQFLLQDGAQARHQKTYERNFLQEVRILPEYVHFDTDTIITPQKLVIVQLTEPITTFVLENSAIINAHKQYFEVMWKLVRS
jgi:sugar-specific transcriptional regulator TrmB